MSAFHKMVSLEMTEADKEEKVAETANGPAAVAAIPNVPWGLRICLTEVELEKLGLDPMKVECEVGDTCHIFALAKVTSVSHEDTGMGPKCRIELSITDMAVEDEDDEEAEEAA